MWVNPVGHYSVRSFPPPGWTITNPILSWYKLGKGYVYHTGNDLNLAGTRDVDEPVYAITDGTVVYAQYLKTSTWLGLVVVKHEWDGHFFYTRYAHMRPPEVQQGQKVFAGHLLGHISPTAGTVAEFEPHLHFDISKLDDRTLGLNPTNWPGANKQFILDHYQDPRPFMMARLVGDDGSHEEEPTPMAFTTKQYKVATTVDLTLRKWPDLQSDKVAGIPPNSLVTASDQIKVSEDNYVWTYVEFTDKDKLVQKGWVASVWLEGF